MNNTETARIRISIETRASQKYNEVMTNAILLTVFQFGLLIWSEVYPLITLEFKIIFKLAVIVCTGCLGYLLVLYLSKHRANKNQLIEILRDSTSEEDFWNNEKVGEIMYS